MKKQKPKLDNAEQSLILFKKAAKEGFKFAHKKIAEAKAECKKLATANIATANKCREAGLAIQTLCGHSHIAFEFWQEQDCTRKLGIGFETAKWFVQIANRYPDKITTLDEAAPVIIQVYFACDLLEPPTREEAQQALTVSLFQRSLAEITTVRQIFEKAWRETPLEKMRPSQLDDFLAGTEWLDVARQKALMLRSEEFKK